MPRTVPVNVQKKLDEASEAALSLLALSRVTGKGGGTLNNAIERLEEAKERFEETGDDKSYLKKIEIIKKDMIDERINEIQKELTPEQKKEFKRELKEVHEQRKQDLRDEQEQNRKESRHNREVVKLDFSSWNELGDTKLVDAKEGAKQQQVQVEKQVEKAQPKAAPPQHIAPKPHEDAVRRQKNKGDLNEKEKQEMIKDVKKAVNFGKGGSPLDDVLKGNLVKLKGGVLDKLKERVGVDNEMNKVIKKKLSVD